MREGGGWEEVREGGGCEAGSPRGLMVALRGPLVPVVRGEEVEVMVAWPLSREARE